MTPKGQSKKLHHPWTGPFRVVKMLSQSVYRIQNVHNPRQRLVVHFDRFKLCPPDMRIPIAIPPAPRPVEFTSASPDQSQGQLFRWWTMLILTCLPSLTSSSSTHPTPLATHSSSAQPKNIFTRRTFSFLSQVSFLLMSGQCDSV